MAIGPKKSTDYHGPGGENVSVPDKPTIGPKHPVQHSETAEGQVTQDVPRDARKGERKCVLYEGESGPPSRSKETRVALT